MDLGDARVDDASSSIALSHMETGVLGDTGSPPAEEDAKTNPPPKLAWLQEMEALILEFSKRRPKLSDPLLIPRRPTAASARNPERKTWCHSEYCYHPISGEADWSTVGYPVKENRDG
jgi:hypothetical protein